MKNSHNPDVPDLDELWIPLVDEPIGSIVDRIVPHDAIDDPADRLVDERDPELLEFGHARIMPRGEVP